MSKRNVETFATPLYPYNKSLNGSYILLRDGVEVMRGFEQDVWRWIHQRHSFSVSEALLNQGYSMVPEEVLPAPTIFLEPEEIRPTLALVIGDES
jgi:hypothetical protein